MNVRLAICLSTCLGIGLSTSFAAADEPFKPLFDGESLEGWTQRNGTATYRIEGNAIVGTTSEGSPNSFLCTDKLYGDFELTFDVKVDDALNSGVQIRSQTKGDTPDGRVNGPQVEIEAARDGKSLSGFVYGEAAGGWMTPDDRREPHPYFHNGRWNAYRVRAVGPRIEVWINGEQVSDLTHEEKYRTHPRGFIGLQVHGIGRGTGPYEVRWRDLKIRELDAPQESDWITLFNGKDLTNWKTSGNWTAQSDGTLLIHPRPGEKGWQRYDDYLWSDRTYGNFVLDLEYAYPPGGNSGVYFRVGDRNDPVETGIEVQILDSSNTEGALTHHDHGGVIRTVGPTRNMSKPPHEFNHMMITCRDNHLEVVLNGEKIIDVELDETPMKDRPLEGYIGLQDHGEPNNLKFRNIRIKEF